MRGCEMLEELEHLSKAQEGRHCSSPLLPTALCLSHLQYGFWKDMNYNSVEPVTALINSISLLPAPDRVSKHSLFQEEHVHSPMADRKALFSASQKAATESLQM